MKKNFCSELQATVDLVVGSCPWSKSGKCTVAEFAFWQWASSAMTLNPSLKLNVVSVAMVDDSIFGFPEFNYFKIHFMEKTKSNANVQNAFKDINMGDPKSSSGNFYSELFYIPDPDYRGEVPWNSLFNLQTLQWVMNTFKDMPDLI